MMIKMAFSNTSEITFRTWKWFFSCMGHNVSLQISWFSRNFRAKRATKLFGSNMNWSTLQLITKKLRIVNKTKLIWIHCQLLCIFLWWFWRLALVVHFKSHSGQGYGFSPVCTKMWVLMLKALLDTFWQNGHPQSPWPIWIGVCKSEKQN